MVWIRPAWLEHQPLKDGTRALQIGSDASGKLLAHCPDGVSGDELYFIGEEGKGVKDMLAGEATLVVTTLDDSEEKDEGPWWLDICLDYFACRNPFLDTLSKTRGDDAAKAVRSAFRAAPKSAATARLRHRRARRGDTTVVLIIGKLKLWLTTVVVVTLSLYHHLYVRILTHFEALAAQHTAIEELPSCITH